MKVLVLTEAPDHPCYRYRIEAFAWALAERGLYLEAVPLGRGLGRLRTLWDARRADVVILQRKLLPLGQLVLLRRRARRLVYDFDDALWQRDSYSPKGPESWSRAGRFWATVYAADAVVAGNDYLAGAARAYAPPERVHVVPTCVDPGRYRPAGHVRRGAAARLVWIGQGSTLPSLRAAEAQFSAAAERVPGLGLRLICDRSIELGPLRVEPCPWSTATEADDLAGADVGVSWLPDDTWSPGKCGLRVLQFMAAGLPVVANPVGINRRMVIDGRTGFLAESPGQWADAVARLAADPALRRRMGVAGRRLVEAHYSVARWAPELAALLECGDSSPLSSGSSNSTSSSRPPLHETVGRIAQSVRFTAPATKRR